MGSSIQMVLLSMKPEFNDKVNVVISFAPVAILTHKLPGLIHTIGIKYGKQLQVRNFKENPEKKQTFFQIQIFKTNKNGIYVENVRVFRDARVHAKEFDERQSLHVNLRGEQDTGVVPAARVLRIGLDEQRPVQYSKRFFARASSRQD